MSQIDDLTPGPTADSPVGPITYGFGAVLLVLWGALGSLALPPMALFLPVVLPVALWVAWNDMAHMKIPNQAVSVLLLSYAVLGLFAFPLEGYMWRWGHFAILIVAGFLANLFRLVGAGDAKFIAAMGPLMALEDLSGIIRLFAATLLAAFVTHRLVRAIPALRALAPGWESWERRDFPMGFALGGVLGFYVLILAIYGR